MTNDAAWALAACLESIERREFTLDQYLARHSDQPPVLTELVPLAQQLRAAPSVTPSLDFRADARRRLIAQLPPRHSRPVQHTRQLKLIRVMAVLIILIVLGSSVVVASAQSLPNEVLYPVKITIEQVQLALSPDQLTRSELSLGFASERLSEVQRLIERDQAGAAAAALDVFVEQIQSAADTAQNAPNTLERESVLAHLHDTLEQLDAELSNSEQNLPASVQPAVRRAHAALRAVPPEVTPEVPPTLTPTPTPTSADRPEPPTRAPRLTPTPQPGVLPTLRPTHAVPTTAPTMPAHWPTLGPTRWPIGLPTLWATLVPTQWLTPIATWQPTNVPPAWPTHPPLATPVWPTRWPTRPPVATPPAWPTWPSAGTPPAWPTWPSVGTPPATRVWPTPRHH